MYGLRIGKTIIELVYSISNPYIFDIFAADIILTSSVISALLH